MTITQYYAHAVAGKSLIGKINEILKGHAMAVRHDIVCERRKTSL